MRIVLAAAVLAAASAARAESASQWYMQVDNDVVFGLDRWYTSGVRIARVARSDGARYELGIHQEIYTPEAKRWLPGVDDRAPSGRIFVYGARHQQGDEAFDTLEIAAGVRGPSALGREASEAVHRIVPAHRTDWTREEGDRFDARIAAVRSLSLGESMVAHYGGILGNELAFAHAGVDYRVGSAIRAHTPAMRYAPTPPPTGDTGWGGFIGVGARLIALNELIGRNYDPLGPELKPRRTVARGVFGVTYLHRWGTAVLAIVRDTREFYEQRQPHGFGSLTLHVNF